ncbi:hypothetical protein [Vitiosangium sp. GDMCC 1.1324]|uniref:hypothetical protein n=1 Tax=Vitiosangium sp. (strain GDMCC 1.1324) TaxID=2138576 RepID=UPI000D35F65A|nr:hypothetical protein [Vitiosangium sp. GDMCC 1.1324]PTL85320.1 hypothetical protein DAT35_00940 [Vitiosangium sp. GDMCC 1.1324]
MTAPSSKSPETPAPVPSERPRLIINGEPVRPEDLGRNLSASVLLRLSITKEPYVPPEPLPELSPPPVEVTAFSALRWGILLAVLGLVAVAALLFLR